MNGIWCTIITLLWVDPHYMCMCACEMFVHAFQIIFFSLLMRTFYKFHFKHLWYLRNVCLICDKTKQCIVTFFSFEHALSHPLLPHPSPPMHFVMFFGMLVRLYNLVYSVALGCSITWSPFVWMDRFLQLRQYCIFFFFG